VIPIDFLLSSPDPWVRYRTRVDLLGEGAEPDRRAVLRHPLVRKLLREARRWPGDSRADHRSGKDLLNKICLLAHFGVRRGDPGVAAIADGILEHRDGHGRILNHVVMPRRKEAEWLFDVDGQEPLLALLELGFGDEPRVKDSVAALVGLALPDGGWVWPEAPSPLPCRKFAGGCPYPTVKNLRILAALPAGGHEAAARAGTELVLDLWARRAVRYGFGMAEQFRKLKYPFLWFDILHVLEALSRFPWVWSDRRFREMIAIVRGKEDAEGRYTPESVWMEWKALCFGQKKAPSPWLSLVVHRILRREQEAGRAAPRRKSR
jgi:hypothetical protein